MADLTTVRCPSCGSKLQITRDIERFACRHCGTELVVTRDRGSREASAQVVQPYTSLDAVSSTLVPVPSITQKRGRAGLLARRVLPLLMALFWCCVFPLIFILPPLLSDSGKCALTTAQSDPAVIRDLGEPIRPVFSFTFYYSQEGAVTQEQYLIVLNGPKGFGFLLISGYQDPTSDWLEVEFNKGDRSYRIYGGPRDCSENLIR